jgi:ParB family chromosome partitioning protein
MSKKLGKDRSTITNYIRLLKLDPIIQSGIRDKFISMGHGRAIINLESHEKQLFIYEQILKNNLSVRQTEKRVRNLDEIKSKKKDKEIDKSINYQIEKIESKINSKTDFKLVKNKGILSFIFSSKNDLIRILKKLND